MLCEWAVKKDNMTSEERNKAYNNNTNKLQSMTLGQCNRGMQNIIEAHTDNENNQYDLQWILKMIKLASKEPSTNNNVIYPQLPSTLCSISWLYKNKLAFNVHHQQFIAQASTLENCDALIGQKCALDWEAT